MAAAQGKGDSNVEEGRGQEEIPSHAVWTMCELPVVLQSTELEGGKAWGS